MLFRWYFKDKSYYCNIIVHSQMKRIHNFSAGPAMLPQPVLEKVAAELLSYQGKGYSIIETSHRSRVFLDVLASAQTHIRQLMQLDERYHVLFLHGGATSDFYRVPQNFLLSRAASAAYIDSGVWTKKAIALAQTVGTVNIVASGADTNFTAIPECAELNLDPHNRYLYLCSNNTIYGTQYQSYPKPAGIPLIGDFTSDIFSREVDYSQFSLILASAQKNLGPAGCTVVVIEDSFLQSARDDLPNIHSYKALVKENCLINTPPVFAIYMIDEVLKWIIAEGGVAVMEQRNCQKAALLYDYLDATEFYRPVALKHSRSLMNITWTLPSQTLTEQFVATAAQADIIGIKGHRSVGGIRASIYNAIELSSIEKLIDFMKQFEKTHH